MEDLKMWSYPQHKDDILKSTWPDRVMHPRLRNPTSTWGIVEFVKLMTREVRVRAPEEYVESKMRPTLTN
eukprot:12937424-Prorocentrum_lima.AAC.1